MDARTIFFALACLTSPSHGLRGEVKRKWSDQRLGPITALAMLLHSDSEQSIAWRMPKLVTQGRTSRTSNLRMGNQAVWGWKPLKTLDDGTKIFEDGSKILPDGTKVMVDGSKLLPDGTMIGADGSSTPPLNRLAQAFFGLFPPKTLRVEADGTKIFENGSKILPDGTRVGIDGSQKMPDGSQVKADGTIMFADGKQILPDGSTMLVDGTKIMPDGTTIMPDGTTVR